MSANTNFTITLPSYQIHLGCLPKLTYAQKVLVITNPKIAGLHIQRLFETLDAQEIYCHTLPDGERYKDFTSVESVLESAFNHRLDRNSLMIAFGGGVIGDIVGFASGIFMRGIDFVQIPTTLLSQVDSSVGGKTGVNHKFGKNLIGLFHQPKAVYIDPYFLGTLPQNEFSAGMAEIIKMSVCFSADFFKRLENFKKESKEELLEVIHKAICIKAKVVAEDERECGIRAALNYGHTFGHVIEMQSGYGTYLHGEAVGMGIVMANKLALRLKLITQNELEAIKSLLEKFLIPTSYRIADVNAFYQAFFMDKKSLHSRIKFVLPKGIGSFCFRDDIPKELVLEVLEEFL